MKVCIVTDQHLSANPRVWKEAKCLVEAGYDVSIVTKFNSSSHRVKDYEMLTHLPERIAYIPAYSTIKEDVSTLKLLIYKGLPKLAQIIKRWGIDTRFLISNALHTTYSIALQQSADLYIAHVEGGFYVGRLLIKNGKKVAFDFEDWYSKDYLVSTRPVALLKSLERFAIDNGVYITAASRSMAHGLSTEYGSSRDIDVIYNGFPIEKDVKQADNAKPVLVWFSQTVGAGRGLERLISSLHNLDVSVELLLIGNCSVEYKKELELIFPTGKHDLKFVPPVKHEELHGYLSKCDIGLALEDYYPESRNTTVTNKMLQYLQAGLKVLATDTLGQKEIKEQLGDAIELVSNNDISNWSGQIENLLSKNIDNTKVVKKYASLYSWEAQEKKLLHLVKNAISA